MQVARRLLQSWTLPPVFNFGQVHSIREHRPRFARHTIFMSDPQWAPANRHHDVTVLQDLCSTRMHAPCVFLGRSNFQASKLLKSSLSFPLFLCSPLPAPQKHESHKQVHVRNNLSSHTQSATLRPWPALETLLPFSRGAGRTLVWRRRGCVEIGAVIDHGWTRLIPCQDAVPLHTSWQDYVLFNPALLAALQAAAEARQPRHSFESWEEAHAFLAPCQDPFMELTAAMCVNASKKKATLWQRASRSMRMAIGKAFWLCRSCAVAAPSFCSAKPRAPLLQPQLSLRVFFHACMHPPKNIPLAPRDPRRRRSSGAISWRRGVRRQGRPLCLLSCCYARPPFSSRRKSSAHARHLRPRILSRPHWIFAAEVLQLCDFFLNHRLEWIFCFEVGGNSDSSRKPPSVSALDCSCKQTQCAPQKPRHEAKTRETDPTIFCGWNLVPSSEVIQR